MNFNDHPEDSFILHTDQDDTYQSGIRESSDYDNRLPIKSKFTKDVSTKGSLLRGKQNEYMNQNNPVNKNIITNHSFNGFFNQNNKKTKKISTEFMKNNLQFSDVSNQAYQINSPTSFNSSGKLSNLQFVTESSKTLSQGESIHQEMKQLLKKYFPDNYQSGHYDGQYLSIQDFMEILFEEFQNLIGKQSSLNLYEDFSDKIFIIFGEQIFFNELFVKTMEKGLTGLIFEIVTAINQDNRGIKESRQNKLPAKQHPPIKTKESVSSKKFLNLNQDHLKSQKSHQTIKINDTSMQNSNFSRSNTTKISLDKYFGSSISKIQLNEDSKIFYEDPTGIEDQNIQEVKRIIQDYIEGMYEQAEQKLNKRYGQQMRKVTLKYKETQKLLQKVNEKISNHYDSIQVQKQYEKKIKQMSQRETQLQNRVKKLQQESKKYKDEAEKEKLQAFKLDQELTKLKEKLQKYQNAFFEKAMQKGSINGNSRIKEQQSTNNSIYSQQGLPCLQQKSVDLPRFELKVDTFTEHRPVIAPLSPLAGNTLASPYMSRHLSNNLTPSRVQVIDNRSVSPIRQRISFNKTQNPVMNSRLVTNQKSTTQLNDNSRIIYSGTLVQNDNVKLVTPNQCHNVEVGEKTHLRPLSPIGKLGESSMKGMNHTSSNSRMVINTLQSPYNPVSYTSSEQRSYSPIKVQFCSSRVTTINTQN